jgi:hypothetical protein
MKTAIPAGKSPASPAASTTHAAEYTWFRVPDLNRATHRRLGQSGAGWTFETICRLVHLVGRVGKPQAKKAARELGRLGVGVQAIAAEAGVSVSKVRRDLVKLVELNLVAVSRRNVTFKADPATGKILENRTGRSLPVLVFLTIGPDHLRSKAGDGKAAASPPKTAPSSPLKLRGAGTPNRDHFGGGIQRDENTKRVPDGDAVGIGTPPAREAGRQEAAEAGGHPAAKASQEGATVRIDAGTDDLPVPIGVAISRPRQSGNGRQAGRTRFPEDKREPVPFAGRDADRVAATLRRLEAEKAARDAEDAAWRAERERQEAAEAARPVPAPPNATDAATSLQAAVDALPATSRQKAKRIGKRMSKAERQAEADAARLLRLIEEKRREEETGNRGTSKALKAAAGGERKTKKARPVAAAQEAGV